MRVITTWMYFDKSQLENTKFIESRRSRRRPPEEEREYGIGIGWFAGGTTNLMTPIDNLKAFRALRRSELAEEEALSLDNLRSYIDLFLADADEFEFDRPSRSLKNEAVVDFVLSQPFVIERSPPIHVTLKGLITSTNLPIWIGTYMGWHALPEPSILLFITVPGGIIVVSSAAGLAGALAAGLSKSVKRLFRTR